MAPAGHASQPLPGWARLTPDARVLVLTLHVQPGARTSGPAGRHGDALKLRIAQPASGNRANEALVDFLHRALDLPRAQVRIVHGAGSRRKIVELSSPLGAAPARLQQWDSA